MTHNNTQSNNSNNISLYKQYYDFVVKCQPDYLCSDPHPLMAQRVISQALAEFADSHELRSRWSRFPGKRWVELCEEFMTDYRWFLGQIRGSLNGLRKGRYDWTEKAAHALEHTFDVRANDILTYNTVDHQFIGVRLAVANTIAVRARDIPDFEWANFALIVGYTVLELTRAELLLALMPCDRDSLTASIAIREVVTEIQDFIFELQEAVYAVSY